MNEIATTILLTKGFHTIIDLDDYDAIKDYKWHILNANTSRGLYAVSTTFGKRVLLHRLLTGAQVGEIVDHINGDTLDNRRCNLRKCTVQQNAFNQTGRCHYRKSKYKGISLEPDGRFRAQIMVNRKQHNLGRFAAEEDAALAYNEAALRLHGEFARLNKIPPEVPPLAVVEAA